MRVLFFKCLYLFYIIFKKKYLFFFFFAFLHAKLLTQFSQSKFKLNLGSETSMTISESFGFRNIRIETSPVNLNYYRNTKLIPKPKTNFSYLKISPDMLKPIS